MKMAARVHGPLKVIGFSANGIWRQRYELSKQLQDLHIPRICLRDISKPMRDSLFQIIIDNWTDCFPGRKGRNTVAVRKVIPHNHVDLPPLV
jgi:hypothetical protein